MPRPVLLPINKLVLLDRDGVINHDVPEGILRVADFVFLPRAVEAIAQLTGAGFHIAICTNQSAVGKGLLDEETLTAIHEHLCAAVVAGGGRIDRIYSALEAPSTPSLRRKPAPGMLHEALTAFAADAAQTPMVGDMLRDLEAAAAAGCPRILTRSGKGAALERAGIPPHVAPVTVCDDLYAAAQHICATYR